MPPIDDPRAIRFANETLRPLCERFLATAINGDLFLAEWGQVKDLFPDDAMALLEDGREKEGISKLNGAEVNLIATMFGGLMAAINDSSNDTARTAINKAKVRQIRVSEG